MGSVEPSLERVQELLEGADDAPIVTINLLRYRARADYPEDFAAEPCTGREAYGRYGATAIQLISASGGRILWLGSVQTTVIAPEGEEWDDAVLVEAPRELGAPPRRHDPQRVGSLRRAIQDLRCIVAPRPGPRNR